MWNQLNGASSIILDHHLMRQLEEENRRRL